MRGKILDFSIQESKGIILADNGERFNFVTAEWKGTKSPSINQVVDFSTNNEMAEAIYSVSNEGSKSKIVAGILALFLGGFGIHKFYLGCTASGIIMLVVFLFGFILLGIPSFIIGLIAFIEALIYFFKSDDKFEEIYVNNKKCWF
ncbi:MAG: TM2 domain-containing protein [Arcobacter sp.]|jgi:TM2 domain-containing membrane protein YozV|uniref:TM2 domain-containing protein n=1 Tax=Arcobacter sp. TaxID=1872629 RepID=UPI002588793B|nr:TM2 domain-containing protein [Arcobacter sp.]MDD3009145.1 TM2 domain-containing protein [Arcobacter sp.]MDY3203923.1 TM2 domain-containing protein [Arcobacter sp.]